MGIVFAFTLALMLNSKVKGQVVYRTIYFLPTLVQEVALAFVWIYLFTPGSGLINIPFEWFGIYGLCWMTCPEMARQTLVLLALWIIGQASSALPGWSGCSTRSLRCRDVDGAGFFRRLWNVTVPIMTPVIFFHLVTSLIVLRSSSVILIHHDWGHGIPTNSTLFYSIYLYKQAFQYFSMGYASALAWLLFMT